MLSAFFKENAKAVENEKVAVSDRFVGEDGKPELWEIRAIDSKTNEEIKQQYQRKERVPGRNYDKIVFDETGYMYDLIVHCVVYPDLFNAQLQDTYGVKDPVDLLLGMLTAGELTKLNVAINKINGFDVSFEDKVDTAKN